MKTSLTTRFYIGFTVAIVLVLGVSAITFLTLRKQAEQANIVKHTYKVMNKLEDIQTLLVNMETGRRGFRCTNEKSFLEPYYRSQPLLAPNLAQLRGMILDGAQAKRAELLDSDVHTIDTFWQHINIALVASSQPLKVYVTMKEKVYMDIIRKDIAEMAEAQRKLLTQREAANQKTVDEAIWILVIGTLLTLSIVAALIVLILREFKSRMLAQQELESNFAQLEVLNNEATEKNWQLIGASAINDSLQGTVALETLALKCVDTIIHYMRIPAGAFYFYDNNTNKLTLTAAAALPSGHQKSYAINEGIVGNAATKKKPTVVKDIPANYWQLQSAGGQAVPNTIICVPLWMGDDLKGVIELASFAEVQQKHTELLGSVANNIAIALNAADARHKVMVLLGQVQEQKEELESQQEELRQSNEELTRQSEILQASEEELRVQGEELKHANVELEEKNEAVEVTSQALAVKAAELEQSSKYKSEFLANMSHELRTPLNSVLILAKLLSDNKSSNLTDKQVEYSKIIHKSGNDLLTLINDILDLSKIEAGKIDLYYEDVPVQSLALDMKQLFKVLSDEKGINFIIQVQDNIPEKIVTDRQRLGQIIKNLLSNAFKFTPKYGSVTLTFYTENDKDLFISVADTGIGIPKEKQLLIFEAFQQADGATTRKYGGTGLGLSISKELAKNMGGELKLQSIDGEGSTFTIRVPVTQIIEKAPDTLTADHKEYTQVGEVTEQTELPDDRNNITKGDKVMLIVEDDPNFATIVRDFAREKQYKTIVALKGDEGLFYARKYKPAAIILDLNLPVIDGRSILKILRNDEELKTIPIHIVSAEDESKLNITGANGYTHKPLDAADLERAFAGIASMVKARFKQLLVITANGAIKEPIAQALHNPNIHYDIASTEAEAAALLKDKTYDCVIADIENKVSGIALLKTLKALPAEPKPPYIAYIDSDISMPDEMALRKYADTIVQSSTEASGRLLDELELFLYKLKQQEKTTLSARDAMRNDKSLEGKKVLVADDDMRNVFSLTSLLENEGMNIITASDGKEAIAVLKENTDVDMILMDIMMPEMDGLEAIKIIRDQAKFKKLPIVAVTAKAMAGDRERCIEAGASDYITKPVDSVKLFSLMRVWLSK